jgi:hypothetical protein
MRNRTGATFNNSNTKLIYFISIMNFKTCRQILFIILLLLLYRGYLMQILTTHNIRYIFNKTGSLLL